MEEKLNIRSPKKRKTSEYHDPDYQDQDANDEFIQSSSQRIERIYEIISNEFEQEIIHKHKQMEEIRERLNQAQKILNKLRYSIVAEYYRKTEIPLIKKETKPIGDCQTLFSDEHMGTQRPLHPSLKKIIGKKPLNYDFSRSCPERTASVQAKETMRARTTEQRRNARQIQQIIREKGIVVDHTTEIVALHNQATGSNIAENPVSSNYKALNVTRLNNKSKHLIVVGNTSKYIGADNENISEMKLSGQSISHKWLVYVQAKDADKPLENYVKKIRFHLHKSYRPNDVVEICEAPFQISRMGWGEFPIRIQIFFLESFQQKPVLFVHNIVLDKSMSGLHTLGSETLVEVWLRSLMSSDVNNVEKNAPKLATATSNVDEKKTSTPGIISIAKNEEEVIDENLFAFLNNIEDQPTSASADIEKLQPTVLVTVPIDYKVEFGYDRKKQKNHSLICGENEKPTKNEKAHKSSLENKNNIDDETFVRTSGNLSKPSSNLPSKSTMSNTNGRLHNHILQKKLVQLIDCHGKVKNVQMFIQPAFINNSQVINKSTMPQAILSNSLRTKKDSEVSKIGCPTVMTEQTSGTNITLSNGAINNLPRVNKAIKNVFQKEGKLYVIDPLQAKLKQSQKQKQVSLLKPHINRQKQIHHMIHPKQVTTLQSVRDDHDYAPMPVCYQVDATPSVEMNLSKCRINASNDEQLYNEKRCNLAQRFLKERFVSMRDAVEYLLRRLPLIGCRESNLGSLSLVRHTFFEFQKLDTFKQRACEWIRSKIIARYMHSHSELRNLHLSNKENFWSTREIVIFARCFAFTPPIKATILLQSKNEGIDLDYMTTKQFSALVKNELKDEHKKIHNGFLMSRYAAWIDNMSMCIKANEYGDIDNDIIDVDRISVEKCILKHRELKNHNNNLNMIYLSPPGTLNSATELMSDICRRLSLQLHPEEIVQGVSQPAALTMFAQSIQLFIEKILRQAFATKYQFQMNQIKTFDVETVDAYKIDSLTVHDISAAITQSVEFDFLVGRNYGVFPFNSTKRQERL